MSKYTSHGAIKPPIPTRYNMPTDNPKIHALFIDEEMTRVELSKNIDSLLTRINDDGNGGAAGSETEQVLIAVNDYMAGVKELTDLLKDPTRDTEPHRMSFDPEKAPTTERCVCPDPVESCPNSVE
jgi:hypothetical protein